MSHPFRIAFKTALPHGILVGVHLPGDGTCPEEAIERLYPEEQEVALGHKGYRRMSFVGGRLAAHTAIKVLGFKGQPIASDPRGAPIAPQGVSLSISHKDRLAVALAARAKHGAVGVDLEKLGPPRPAIASKVLTAEEAKAIDGLEASRQWTAIILRFTIKEAIYKATAPTLARYIGFDEAFVEPSVEGWAAAELSVKKGEPKPSLSAKYRWLDDHVVATVRARFDPQD